MNVFNTKHQLLLLVSWVLFAFFWNIWSIPLFDLDEGAFSAATWEMLQRNDYLTTYLNGELRFDKPILIYWLQAASVHLLGITEMAFRLPSSIAAFIWLWVTYRFAQRYLDQSIAITVALMMSTAFMIVLISHAATADALLNLLMTLTLFNIYHYFTTKQTRYIYWVYFWMALGVLCKGPIAILVPLSVSLFYAIWDKQLRTLLGAVFHPKAWLLFLLIALPWYVLEYLAQGQAFIDGFFLKHNIGRFTKTMHSHAGYLWYYIPVILLVIMPFGGWLIQVLSKGKSLVSDPLGRFLFSWFIFVFLFFSFSSSQLPHYILYGTIPLLLLMARYHKDITWRSLAFLPIILFALFVFGLPLLLEYMQKVKPNDILLQALYKHGKEFFGIEYWLISSSLLVIISFLFFYKKWQLSQRLLIAGVAQTIVLLLSLYPAIAWLQQEPVRQAANYLKKQNPQPRVWMHHINMPSMTTYRQVITPKGKADIGDWVFTRIDRLDNIENYIVHYSKGGIMLAERIH